MLILITQDPVASQLFTQDPVESQLIAQETQIVEQHSLASQITAQHQVASQIVDQDQETELERAIRMWVNEITEEEIKASRPQPSTNVQKR